MSLFLKSSEHVWIKTTQTRLIELNFNPYKLFESQGCEYDQFMDIPISHIRQALFDKYGHESKYVEKDINTFFSLFAWELEDRKSAHPISIENKKIIKDEVLDPSNPDESTHFSLYHHIKNNNFHEYKHIIDLSINNNDFLHVLNIIEKLNKGSVK